MKRKTLRTMAALLMTAIALSGTPNLGGGYRKLIAAEKKAKLSKTSVTLKVGKKLKLKVKNLSKTAKVKWVSSKKSVASVGKKDGFVKAKKAGKAKITAMISEKGKKTIKLTCKVTVKKGKKKTEAKKTEVKKKEVVVEKIKDMTVSTQIELDQALKNVDLEELKIKSEKEVALVIPEGTYDRVNLVVEVPKADVTNYGKFKKILINEIKEDTWIEMATGNEVEVRAKKARVLVASEATSKRVIIAEGSEAVKVEVLGKLEGLSVVSEAKLDVTVKGKIDLLNISKKADVTLVSEGEIKKVDIQAASKLSLKGKSEKLEVEVKKEAEGSSIATEIPVQLKAASNISLILEKGAENSQIEAVEKNVDLKVENKTEKTIEIKTEEGIKKVENQSTIAEQIWASENWQDSPKEYPQKKNVPLRDRGPLMGAYYRTWHDVASTGDDGAPHGGLNRMSEIPEEVDLAFVFTDWTAKDSKFWDVLKNQYVPKLKAQGTRVIRTIGIRELTSERGVLYETGKELIHPDGLDEAKLTAKYAEYARIIYDEYVGKYNLNGLDIDLEQHDEPNNSAKRKANPKEDEKCHKQTPEIEEKKFLQAIGIIKELKKITGNDGHETGQLLILDTTIPAEKSRIFQDTATLWDYILVQKYGQHLGRISETTKESYGQEVFKEFKRYGVKPEHFMYGFSFYEEDGDKNNNVWADTVSLDTVGEGVLNTLPLDPRIRSQEALRTYKWHLSQKVLYTRNPGTPFDSNAYRHSIWQPDNGIKGGIFSYAIDRDGVEEGIDATKEKCGRRDPNIPYSISEQSDYYGKWGDNTKHLHTKYLWTKALKKSMKEDENYQPITEAEIPDPAFRNAVIRQIGRNWKGNIERFDGELVLDDPAISNLEGLEKFKNLKKLTLKGLVNIKSLKKDNLPESLKPDYGKAPYEGVRETLVLEGLTGLESLDLSGFDFEHLPIADPVNFVNLISVDVSANRIDFASGEDKSKLETLYGVMKEKSGLKFAMQRPQGYMPKEYRVSLIDGQGEDRKILVNGLFAFAGSTANGTIVDKNAFQEYLQTKVLSDSQVFIDPDYTWAAFSAFSNEDNNVENLSFDNETQRNRVKITDHTSADVTKASENGISRKTESTYFLTYTKYYEKMKLYDEKGNYIGESAGYRELCHCKIVVGTEQKKLKNYGLNAKVLGTSFGFLPGVPGTPIQRLAKLFNGNTFEKQGEVTYGMSIRPEGYDWFVFDLGGNYNLSKAVIYNVYKDAYESESVAIKKAKLQYFNGEGVPTEEEMENSDKWVTAEEFDSENEEEVKVRTKDLQGVTARYWRYRIEELQSYSYLRLSEIQMMGEE